MIPISFQEKNNIVYMKVGELGTYKLDQVINSIFVSKIYDSVVIAARDKAKNNGQKETRQVLNEILTEVREQLGNLELKPTNDIVVDFKLNVEGKKNNRDER